MALSSTSRPSIRGRVLSRLPATFSATGGLGVSKENGIWTLYPDFSLLDEITAPSLTDPSTKQVWIYDPDTDVYNVLTLADLGDALYSATSASSLSVGVGSKTFITQPNKDFAIGSWVFAYSESSPANYVTGPITGYTNTSLVVNATAYGGSGTVTDWIIRASSPPGAAGKSAGYAYGWLTATTSSDPTAGNIKANNATFASITEIYISETDADANGIAAIIAAQLSGTSTIKCRFKIYDPVTPTNFMEFDATALTDNGTWDTIAVTPRSNGGSFSAALALRVDFYPKGDKGDTGATGAAGGGLANVVDDTTPQLGGQLDVNGQALGDGTRELLKFEETASAINEVTIVNAAVGAGPTVKATGDDTNIDLNLAGKGTGIPKIASSAIIKASGAQTLTGGFKATPYAAGTKSSGTYTPLYSDGNFQTATNGGAHTLAPPADDCTMIIQYTNNGSAGAITTSGFTVKKGDPITTVNGDDFFFCIIKVGSFSSLTVQALQ